MYDLPQGNMILVKRLDKNIVAWETEGQQGEGAVEGHIALQSRACGGLKLYEHSLPQGLLSARHHQSLNYCISIKIAALVLNPITRLLRSLPTLNWHQQRDGKQDSCPYPPPSVDTRIWQLCAQTGQGQIEFSWQQTATNHRNLHDKQKV